MSVLFEEILVNGLKFKNRFVRSATWDGMADPEGGITPAGTRMLTDLAQGGVGLIVTGHAYIRPEGQASPGQLGIHQDSLVPGLAEMVKKVHQAGARIALQLAHAGQFALIEVTGVPALAPSPNPKKTADQCREMTVEEIRDTVVSFGRAAARAQEAGFDAVQIHAAHGYGLSQFLSPAFNRRRDDYGGPLENRVRFLKEAVLEVRQVVGPDFPILVKINCRDFVANGLELEDSLQAAQAIQEAGVDAVEVSGGTVISKRLDPSRMGIKTPDQEAYFREEARAFKQALDIPVILVGGIRTRDLSERLIQEGYCDLISMSRPFIRQPDLVERWRTGRAAQATCLSDNLCFKAGRQDGRVYCLSRVREQEKKG